MIAAVVTRLNATVVDLYGRVEGAAEFTDLMQRNDLPQATPAAFVLPLGLAGQQADAMAGAFTQAITETVGVVLVVRGHDRTGKRALERIDQLIRDVIAALIGWAPANEIGAFKLMRGQLIGLRAGALLYQIDFAISDQLRSTS